MGDGFIKNRTGELARGVLTRMDAIALVGVAALAAYLSSFDVVISRLWCGCLLLVPGFGPAYLIIFIARAFVIVYGLGDVVGASDSCCWLNTGSASVEACSSLEPQALRPVMDKAARMKAEARLSMGNIKGGWRSVRGRL